MYDSCQEVFQCILTSGQLEPQFGVFIGGLVNMTFAQLTCVACLHEATTATTATTTTTTNQNKKKQLFYDILPLTSFVEETVVLVLNTQHHKEMTKHDLKHAVH